MRLASWNVNGLRAVYGKNFVEYLTSHAPDVLGLQETKIQPDQLPKALVDELAALGYRHWWHSAEKKGYSGTAILSKVEPVAIHTGLGIEEFDREGRVLIAEFADFFFYTIYFPNSQETLARLDYKIAFDEALLVHARKNAGKKPVILNGDFNVAHEEIDLAHPKANDGAAGFHPREREWFARLVAPASGFTDVWRDRNPGVKNRYSWWTYRAMARERNVGWRIDYFVVSKSLVPRVTDARIHDEVMGSDHCPVEIDLS